MPYRTMLGIFQDQFTEGLLQFVVEKMNHSIPLVLDNEAVFSHFVDETLLFDKELRNTYDLSQVNSSCLQVLVKQPCFAKWVTLEKKCKFGTQWRSQPGNLVMLCKYFRVHRP